jgi:hypothetical protein
MGFAHTTHQLKSNGKDLTDIRFQVVQVASQLSSLRREVSKRSFGAMRLPKATLRRFGSLLSLKACHLGVIWVQDMIQPPFRMDMGTRLRHQSEDCLTVLS